MGVTAAKNGQNRSRSGSFFYWSNMLDSIFFLEKLCIDFAIDIWLNDFFSLSITEFIQPQHLWPYIQQNLIQQNHLANHAFLTSHHPQLHHPHQQHHPQQSQSPHHPHHLVQMNGASPAANNNNNNNNGSSNSSSGSNCNGNNSCSNTTSEAGSLPNSPDLQDDGTRLQQQQSSAQQPQQQQQQQQPRDNKIIAKPLPSRPMPFLQHGLNHPHLHSLLAHCRNPYLPGKISFPLNEKGRKS